MTAPTSYGQVAKAYLREKRDDHVLAVLAAHNGNRRRAATALGVSIRMFLYWLADMRARGVQVPDRKPCECGRAA